MSNPMGKCSRRSFDDFKPGDRVRVVCVGGREWGLCNHLGQETTIKYVSNNNYHYYGSLHQVKRKFIVANIGDCYGHVFIARALEKINN